MFYSFYYDVYYITLLVIKKKKIAHQTQNPIKIILSITLLYDLIVFRYSVINFLSR